MVVLYLPMLREANSLPVLASSKASFGDADNEFSELLYSSKQIYIHLLEQEES